MIDPRFALYRRTDAIVKTGNQIILNNEIDDQEKLRQLLNLENLKVGISSSVQGNYKLIYFLCEKQNIEKLLRYSISVPESPSNQNESFKFPNVSQELICGSAMLIQAVVEGGFEKMFERAEAEETNGNPNEDSDEGDEEDEEDERDEEDGEEEGDEKGEEDREEGEEKPEEGEEKDQEKDAEEKPEEKAEEREDDKDDKEEKEEKQTDGEEAKEK